MIRPDFSQLRGGRECGVARDELSRDELSTSDNDQGVFEQLHLMNFLLVYTSTGDLWLFFVRAASRCVYSVSRGVTEMVSDRVR